MPCLCCARLHGMGKGDGQEERRMCAALTEMWCGSRGVAQQGRSMVGELGSGATRLERGRGSRAEARTEQSCGRNDGTAKLDCAAGRIEMGREIHGTEE